MQTHPGHQLSPHQAPAAGRAPPPRTPPAARPAPPATADLSPHPLRTQPLAGPSTSAPNRQPAARPRPNTGPSTSAPNRQPAARSRPLAGLAALAILGPLACAPPSPEGGDLDYGRLRLRTSPKGAAVYDADGRQLAVSTPASLLLAPGEHPLKLQLPGAEARHYTVTIGAGEHKELSLRLPPPPPTRLNIFSDVAGATVRINGYKRGRTPLLGIAVRPGAQDITLTAGSEARAALTRLRLGEQRTLQINFGASSCEMAQPGCALAPLQQLAPPRGRLSLGMKPDGEAFTAGGRRLGATPLRRVPIAPGSHRLRLRSKDGRYERWIRVEIDPEQTSVYRIQLRERDQRPGYKPPPPAATSTAAPSPPG